MKEVLKAGGMFVALVPVVLAGGAAVWFGTGWILRERKHGMYTLKVVRNTTY